MVQLLGSIDIHDIHVQSIDIHDIHAESIDIHVQLRVSIDIFRRGAGAVLMCRTHLEK